MDDGDEVNDQQEQQQLAQTSKNDGRRRPLFLLPPIYKIRLHLRKGEPLERRRLTNGLPDPEPFDHVQGQDSYITLKERIAARVRRFSDLFWPENGAPYIKPAESVPQKYYQMLTQDNYEALMAKAWRMGAKRLQDHDLIVLNLFVYLKDKNPLDPAARPAPRESRQPASQVTLPALAEAGRAATVRTSSKEVLIPELQASRSPLPAGLRRSPIRSQERSPRPRPPLGLESPHRPLRPPQRHLYRPRRSSPPGRRPYGSPSGPGKEGRLRDSLADQTDLTRLLSSGKAVVAAINEPITSRASLSSLSTGPSNSASSSSLSTTTRAPVIPITTPTPPPNLITSSASPPLSTIAHTQAARILSASDRHRLSTMPNINPLTPTPPLVAIPFMSVVPPIANQDGHNTNDEYDDNNHSDDLIGDGFDRTPDDDLPPPPSAPPSPILPTQSYSSQSRPPSPLQLQPQSSHSHPQTQQHPQQPQQPSSAANDEDFRTIKFKLGGVVVPVLVDIKSLRDAIFY